MLNTLQDLYLEQLRDLYDAENRLLSALPKMEAGATNDDLRKAFSEHLEETRGHVNRLKEIFQDLGVAPEGETCHAMKGLIAEGSETLSEQGDPLVKDAALIAEAQRVEHYEIAGYGSVSNFARTLGHDRHADLLGETLSEEKSADSLLTKIATGGMFSKGINQEVKA